MVESQDAASRSDASQGPRGDFDLSEDDPHLSFDALHNTWDRGLDPGAEARDEASVGSRCSERAGDRVQSLKVKHPLYRLDRPSWKRGRAALRRSWSCRVVQPANRPSSVRYALPETLLDCKSEPLGEMTDPKRSKTSLLEQVPTRPPTEGPLPGDREAIEEVEELLDRARGFGATLEEYSPEALEELTSAHGRTQKLLGEWDFAWPDSEQEAFDSESEGGDDE